MVTLIGFFFILGNVAIMQVYMPDLIGPVSTGIFSLLFSGEYSCDLGSDHMDMLQAPSWVYFSFAFGMFM